MSYLVGALLIVAGLSAWAAMMAFILAVSGFFRSIFAALAFTQSATSIVAILLFANSRTGSFLDVPLVYRVSVVLAMAVLAKLYMNRHAQEVERKVKSEMKRLEADRAFIDSLNKGDE